jgi:hypothetical protein
VLNTAFLLEVEINRRKHNITSGGCHGWFH